MMQKLTVKTWQEGMTDKETKDIAYWERNMLALAMADGWYFDDVENDIESVGFSGSPFIPRYAGWRRVLSIANGQYTFHVPDDFDVMGLPEIQWNWDGHSTREKWERLAAFIEQKWSRHKKESPE